MILYIHFLYVTLSNIKFKLKLFTDLIGRWLRYGRGDLAHTTHGFVCSNKMDDFKADSEGTRGVSLLKRREKQRKELENKISEVLVLLIHHYKLP